VTKFKTQMTARAVEYMVHKYLVECDIHHASVHTLRHTMATHHVSDHALHYVYTVQFLSSHCQPQYNEAPFEVVSIAMSRSFMKSMCWENLPAHLPCGCRRSLG
jgi:hypothetical protein